MTTKEEFVKWVEEGSGGKLSETKEHGFTTIVLAKGQVCKLPNTNIEWIDKNLKWTLPNTNIEWIDKNLKWIQTNINQTWTYPCIHWEDVETVISIAKSAAEPVILIKPIGKMPMLL